MNCFSLCLKTFWAWSRRRHPGLQCCSCPPLGVTVLSQQSACQAVLRWSLCCGKTNLRRRRGCSQAWLPRPRRVRVARSSSSAMRKPRRARMFELRAVVGSLCLRSWGISAYLWASRSCMGNNWTAGHAEIHSSCRGQSHATCPCRPGSARRFVLAGWPGRPGSASLENATKVQIALCSSTGCSWHCSRCLCWYFCFCFENKHACRNTDVYIYKLKGEMSASFDWETCRRFFFLDALRILL